MSDSVRTSLLKADTLSALKHMFETARKHPFVTLGLATGMAMAVAHHESHDPTSAPSPASPTSPGDQDSFFVKTARAIFAPAYAYSPPVMSGLENTPTARIQMEGAGYDSPAAAAGESAFPFLDLGNGAPVQRPMSSSRRMSAMQDYRYQPSNAITDAIHLDNF